MRISALSKVMQDLNHDLGVLTNDVDRSQLLRNVKPEIKSLINLQYDPRIEFDLPKGRPPFTAIWSDENQNVLYNLLHKKYFKYFIKGSDTHITNPEKRQQMFIDSLKNMYAEDANMILEIKEKKNIWPNITYDLLVMAFPNVVSGWNKKCRIEQAIVVSETPDEIPEPFPILTIDQGSDILNTVETVTTSEDVSTDTLTLDVNEQISLTQSKKKGRKKVN